MSSAWGWTTQVREDGRLVPNGAQGRAYKVRQTKSGLLAIRRGTQWEYYRVNPLNPRQARLTGSTIHFEG